MKQQDIWYNHEVDNVDDNKAYEDESLTIICDGRYSEKNGVFYYQKGIEHREDGPACIWNDGNLRWYLKGKLVYSNAINNLHKFKELPEKLKQSIIKYELSK
jgi:hypothetical protein